VNVFVYVCEFESVRKKMMMITSPHNSLGGRKEERKVGVRGGQGKGKGGKNVCVYIWVSIICASARL
jgi:hypothetical protein